jgi:hypothetical protein
MRVHAKAPAALASANARARSASWLRAATRVPQKVSPAAVVSMGVTAKAGCTRMLPSLRAQHPRAPSVTTTVGTRMRSRHSATLPL